MQIQSSPFLFGHAEIRVMLKSKLIKGCHFLLPCFVLYVSLMASLSETNGQVEGQNVRVSAPVSADDWVKKIVSDREFDFGEVRIGSRAKHVFKFNNPTENEIRIKSISSSCGCTVANVSNKTIRPGATEEITIALNTDSFRGKKKSTIHVLFEEPADKEIQLSLSVDIQNLYVDPEDVRFRDIEVGTTAKKTIQVTREGSPFWNIEKISTGNPHLKSQLGKRMMQGNKVSYEIECSFERTEVGAIQTEIIIETNDTLEKVYKIPVVVEVVPKVQVSIETIEFQGSDLSEEKKFIVKSAAPFEITSLEIVGGEFGVKELKPEKKIAHFVSVTRKSIDQGKGTLKIKTDLGDETIEIPIVVPTK